MFVLMSVQEWLIHVLPAVVTNFRRQRVPTMLIVLRKENHINKLNHGQLTGKTISPDA